MSAAAEQIATACRHPDVKGSRRALLDTIATLIPEGQTMTAAIADTELAPLTGYDKRTIRVARDVLERVGVIRIIGRGQGRVPSYELCALPEAGGPPALPLRADLREVKRTMAPTPLLDRADDRGVVDEDRHPVPRDVSSRAYTVGSFVRRVVKEPRIFFPMFVANIGSFVLSCRSRVYAVGSFVRCVVIKPRIFFPMLAAQRPTSDQVLDVDDARARDVRTHLKEVHTHAPPARAPCRFAGTVHAWCDGRVHVPLELHRDFLRRHSRLAGERDADVEVKLVAFYAQTDATLRPDTPIAENDFTFWRRAYAAAYAPAVTRVAPQPPPPRRADPNVGGSVCRHDPRCDRTTDCIARTITDGRAERDRKSG